MRVFVTGGTGLIGTSLVRRILERGDQPVVLTRQADRARRNPALRAVQFVQGDPAIRGAWESSVDGCDAVVNLVGHNIFADRWSPEVRRKIRDSRVYSTEHVVAAIAKAQARPKVLVQGSAIGYYGPHDDDDDLTESSPSGSDFMAVVCREWEDAAEPVETSGTRLATIRTGVVLAKGGGALAAMVPKYRMFVGAAPVGSGSNAFAPGTGHQWMSWIHLDDIVGIFLLGLDNPAAVGPINGTAPNPVRHVDLGRALAKVLKRPFLPIGPPDAMLELLLGEVAQVVTKGQKVLPARALELGYKFRHPEVLAALRAIFARAPAAPTPAPARPAAAGHHH